MPSTNAAHAVFRENCGSRLEVACANCGGPNRFGTKFRNKSGERLPESGAATLTAAPKFGSVQAYSPKHLAEKMLTFKGALESPDLTGQNFLIGYFLLGILGVTQTATRRVQVV
jgi:hypothetical protein